MHTIHPIIYPIIFPAFLILLCPDHNLLSTFIISCPIEKKGSLHHGSAIETTASPHGVPGTSRPAEYSLVDGLSRIIVQGTQGGEYARAL